MRLSSLCVLPDPSLVKISGLGSVYAWLEVQCGGKQEVCRSFAKVGVVEAEVSQCRDIYIYIPK